VNGVVTVSGGVDAVVSVGQDGGQRLGSAFPRLIEHLRFELGKLVLQVGKVLRKGLDDGRMLNAHGELIGGVQVLGALERRDKVAPESGLLRQARVLGVEIEMRFTEARGTHLG